MEIACLHRRLLTNNPLKARIVKDSLTKFRVQFQSYEERADRRTRRMMRKSRFLPTHTHLDKIVAIREGRK